MSISGGGPLERQAPEGTAVQGEFLQLPPRLYSASASRLLSWLDCPRRYRMTYLDRPKPTPRPQRAHTGIGIAVHNALRDFWDLAPERRTPDQVAELVRTSWSIGGFKNPDQSLMYRHRSTTQVIDYLRGIDRNRQPVGVERTVAFRTDTLSFSGRVDRLDDRDGELVVVDYKTSRRPSTEEDARTSLPLALYAMAVQKMFRRECTRVELHHVPTGAVVAHEHDETSLARKLAEAESIAVELRDADRAYREGTAPPGLFAPNPSVLCTWCDMRPHCPEGQRMGPEQPDWAGLEDPRASLAPADQSDPGDLAAPADPGPGRDEPPVSGPLPQAVAAEDTVTGGSPDRY